MPVGDDLNPPLRGRGLKRLHDPVALLAVGCELPACIMHASIGGDVAAGPYSRVELLVRCDALERIAARA